MGLRVRIPVRSTRKMAPLNEITEPSLNDPEVIPDCWIGTVRMFNPHPFILLADKTANLSRFKRIISWLFRFIRNYPNKG